MIIIIIIISPIKAVPPLFLTKMNPSLTKESKLQSSHYRNVSTDLLGTDPQTVGIYGTHSENHWFALFRL
jgi:aromatic ring-opening dioxygenase catalytic subunit (LigB family)